MWKKVGDVDKKISGISGVVTATVLNRKTRESKNTLKYQTLRQNILLEISEKEIKK